MRIGLLCHSSIGGSARVAMDLSRGLAERGHEVHMFTRRAPWALESDADQVKLHSLQSSGGRDPRLRLSWSAAEREAFVDLLVRVTREHALDVLHFHYAIPFAELVFAAAQRLGARTPMLCGTLHGTDVSSPHAGRIGWFLKQLDALTTVSNSHAELAVQTFGLSSRPRVIGNTIDLRRFSPRVQSDDHTRSPRVLHVSNFRSVKDPARLARAFVEVRRQRSADLWLVGDGDEMPAVREILAGGEAIADVHLFGLRTDVERLYPKADVVVLTSRAESFSLVALEAAASAVPVVAPRVGGLPEVVLDGVTGLLYEHADPAEPARTLLRLLNDRDLHASMGAAAARHAQEFSHERGVEQYEDLYGELLDRRGRLEPAGVRATASGR